MPQQRISVPLDEETRKAFQYMADVQGKSLGSTLAAWLAETAEGAMMVAQAMAKAKESPARALREFSAVAAEFEQRLTAEQAEVRSMLKPGSNGSPVGARNTGAVDAQAPAAPAPKRRRA